MNKLEGTSMESKIKKTIAILLLVCFVVSLTAASASAMYYNFAYSKTVGNENGHAYGTGHNKAGDKEYPVSNAGSNHYRDDANGYSNYGSIYYKLTYKS